MMFRRQHGSSRYKNARSVGINTKRVSRPKLTQTPIKTFHIEPISNPHKRENSKIVHSINEKVNKLMWLSILLFVQSSDFNKIINNHLRIVIIYGMK